MSVVIRLTKTGRRGERKFRIVVSEKRSRRDGQAIENLGWYHKTEEKETKKIDKKRYDYWVSRGAKPSEGLLKILS